MKIHLYLVCLGATHLLNPPIHASSPTVNTTLPINSYSLGNPVPSRSERIAQMKRIVSMTVQEYGKWRGKKLNFFERLSFKISQHRMKQLLKYYDFGEPTTLQKIAWLLKGLLLGPIALLLVYLFASDDERDLIKWVWFGFAGWVVWVTIVVILLLQPM
jgi:hypothetical protein